MNARRRRRAGPISLSTGKIAYSGDAAGDAGLQKVAEGHVGAGDLLALAEWDTGTQVNNRRRHD